MLYRAVAVAIVLVLAGCALTDPFVVEVDGKRVIVQGDMHSPFADFMAAAEGWCVREGRQARLVRNFPIEYGTAYYEFTCVDSGG